LAKRMPMMPLNVTDINECLFHNKKIIIIIIKNQLFTSNTL